jgi:hypothetical protein
MHNTIYSILMASLCCAACGGEDDTGGSSTTERGAGSGGTSGQGAAGHEASGGAHSGGSGGDAGAGGVSAGAGGADGGGSGASGSSGVHECTEVRAALLGAVDQVSGGEVVVFANGGDATSIHVDASAGGRQAAAQNPWIYLSLATASRVDLTDLEADASKGWDLALKRELIRTNSADSGPGGGGAVMLEGRGFDGVSVTDVQDVIVREDDFIDGDTCEATVDEEGKLVSTFSGWYDYDPATHSLAPKDATFIVRSADGVRLYKLRILTYYSTPEGGTGQASGFYGLRLAELTP